MKRALKGFGNVLGQCLANKHYLRWVKKAAITTPAEPKKSETVSVVPADVHRSRYNAIAAKAAATTARPASTPIGASPLKEIEGNTAFEKQAGMSLPKGRNQKGTGISVDTTAGTSNEIDPVKQERKRKQLQKKEEYSLQLKPPKKDESFPEPSCIKSEEPSSSPIPEGFFFQFNSEFC